MLWLGIVAMIAGTVVWHVADVQMLRAIEQDQPYRRVVLWVLTLAASTPLFALSSWALFKVQRSWWIVEFPYLLAGMGISAVLFGTMLQVTISWRELTAGAMLLGAMILVATR